MFLPFLIIFFSDQGSSFVKARFLLVYIAYLTTLLCHFSFDGFVLEKPDPRLHNLTCIVEISLLGNVQIM